MYYIDQLIYFHNEYIQFHDKVDIIFENLLDNKNKRIFEIELKKIHEDITLNQNNLLAFFSLFIIEIAKDIEMKED
jgi:hypothetical protein